MAPPKNWSLKTVNLLLPIGFYLLSFTREKIDLKYCIEKCKNYKLFPCFAFPPGGTCHHLPIGGNITSYARIGKNSSFESNFCRMKQTVKREF